MELGLLSLLRGTTRPRTGGEVMPQWGYRHEVHPQEQAESPPESQWVRGLKAASSKADPGRQQDWILKCLQCEWARSFEACGVATLCWPKPRQGGSVERVCPLNSTFSLPRR